MFIFDQKTYALYILQRTYIIHVSTISRYDQSVRVESRRMEFIDGASRLRGGAKALDVWRLETKPLGPPHGADVGTTMDFVGVHDLSEPMMVLGCLG